MRKNIILWCNYQLFQRNTQLAATRHPQWQSIRHISSQPNRVEQENEANPSSSTKKIVKVAVLGVPNAGKSTFINNLINHRVCATSRKVHTTRIEAKAVCNRSNTQVILFDTPGIVSDAAIKRHHLDEDMNRACRRSLAEANLIAVLHDVSNSWTRNQLDPMVIQTLESYPNLPSILVLNKIDMLPTKRILLDLARLLTENTLKVKDRNYTVWKGARTANKFEKNINRPVKYKLDTSRGWTNFSEVFMVSALVGDGLKTVMNHIIMQGKPGEWEYENGAFTNQSIKELVLSSVRARLLDFLAKNIPYELSCEMEYLETDQSKIVAYVNVICPTSSIEKTVCGNMDGKLSQITEMATSDLVATFGHAVTLTLATTVRKGAQQ